MVMDSIRTHTLEFKGDKFCYSKDLDIDSKNVKTEFFNSNDCVLLAFEFLDSRHLAIFSSISFPSHVTTSGIIGAY